ncbi:hypothetical protein DFJ74DRAFT_673782 [Hyaloraphidium curvatum]|nr:hypothetical protein DFJ74DRAFT_673782 [Hyaloraphidium curvatum]
MAKLTPHSLLSLRHDDIFPGTLESLAKQPSVCIIGGGLSGICAGVQLKRKLGVDNFVVFEAKQGWGGTWADNCYPGAAVDIPTVFYSFSFHPSNLWVNNFSRQPELKLYAESVAAAYNLGPHLLTRTKVERIAWDPVANAYDVTTRDQRKDGLTKTWRFDFVICGVGQLNEPAMPDIPGLDSFAGDKWHSARWREDVSIEGKKVLVIGTGATGAQFIPEVAKVAGDVTVFQRSANWIIRRDEHLISPWHKFILNWVPGVRLVERFYPWFAGDVLFWPVLEQNEFFAKMMEKMANDHLKQLIPGEDEKSVELRKKLTPDYAFGCRRFQFSNTFAPTFLRPNAHLVTDPILRIEPKGVVARLPDGTEQLYEGEVLLLGTGFKVHDFLSTLEVVDAKGNKLAERWKALGGAEAYYGIMVSDLPNLFLTYGPNTNLASNSIIFMIENQVEFALRAIAYCVRNGVASVAVKREVQEAFNAQLQEDISKLVWTTNCTSWYKTSSGKVTNNWSGRTWRYMRETAAVSFGSDAFEHQGKSDWRTPKGTGSWFTSPAGLATIAVASGLGYLVAKVLRK